MNKVRKKMEDEKGGDKCKGTGDGGGSNGEPGCLGENSYKYNVILLF